MIKVTNNNQIVENIYNSEEYNQLIINLINRSGFNLSQFDDLKQDLLIYVLEYEESVKLWNKGEFKYWFTRVAFNQICSKKSAVYSRYIKRNNLKRDIEEYQDFLILNNNVVRNIDNDYILKEIKKIIYNNKDKSHNNKRDYEIFNMYFIKDMTMQKISDITNIPLSNVFKYIKNIEKEIKNKLNHKLFKEYGNN